MRHKAAYGRWVGALAGFVFWFVVVRPIVMGGLDIPLEDRILLGLVSLSALVFGGWLLGLLVDRYIGRG
jgi:hypothetical protein